MAPRRRTTKEGKTVEVVLLGEEPVDVSVRKSMTVEDVLDTANVNASRARIKTYREKGGKGIIARLDDPIRDTIRIIVTPKVKGGNSLFFCFRRCSI